MAPVVFLLLSFEGYQDSRLKQPRVPLADTLRGKSQAKLHRCLQGHNVCVVYFICLDYTLADI